MDFQTFKLKFKPISKVENPENLSFWDSYCIETKEESIKYLSKYIQDDRIENIWSIVHLKGEDEFSFMIIPSWHHIKNSSLVKENIDLKDSKNNSSIMGWVVTEKSWGIMDQNLVVDLADLSKFKVN